MRIDGKARAEGILSDLTRQVTQLKGHGVTPTLAVIVVGNDPESLSYVRQKKLATEKIGGRFIFEQLPRATIQKELDARVTMYNNDPAVTGLIVQRPIPGLTARVTPTKDVDGFEKDSLFEVPVAKSIFTLLEGIDYSHKTIVIVGRGETAGKPIAAAFAKKHCATSIIHSHTPNPKEIMRTADILVSCVGKERVVTADAVKPGALLMSVGLWRGPDNKLHGDYDAEEIKDIAGAYTPTPGGVGPVMIACLMQNLVRACMMKR